MSANQTRDTGPSFSINALGSFTWVTQRARPTALRPIQRTKQWVSVLLLHNRKNSFIWLIWHRWIYSENSRVSFDPFRIPWDLTHFGVKLTREKNQSGILTRNLQWFDAPKNHFDKDSGSFWPKNWSGPIRPDQILPRVYRHEAFLVQLIAHNSAHATRVDLFFRYFHATSTNIGA